MASLFLISDPKRKSQRPTSYVNEGPADGPVVLLLHGQPSWSYLYRKMIPVLVDAGYRVIAMDHLGMGRSDKPIDIQSYSFLGHYDRLERFINDLGLGNINMFVQDWGSLIGLRLAGLNPDLFARIAVGDGTLPVVPEGVQPFPVVENPDEILEIPSIFELIPAQQPPFYDGCELLLPSPGNFGSWMIYSMKAASFRPSEVLEGITWFDLPEDEEAAYDAPFPSRVYMAGPRVFPSLVNELGGLNNEAWEGLMSFERPFLTLWASNDPGNLGQCATQQNLIDSIPGALGQPHDRLAEASHFLQDDPKARRSRGVWSISMPAKTAPSRAKRSATALANKAPATKFFSASLPWRSSSGSVLKSHKLSSTPSSCRMNGPRTTPWKGSPTVAGSFDPPVQRWTARSRYRSTSVTSGHTRRLSSRPRLCSTTKRS